MKVSVGVQLYTLRKETAEDFVGTLERVAEIGYEGVEFAGYGGLAAGVLRAKLDELGLKAAGSHVGLEELRNNLEEVIRYNKEIGSGYIVCPWAEFKDRDEIEKLAGILNSIGKRCREEGLDFCYHNHNHEFKIIDGELGLDILYAETDAECVKSELDTYWVKYAGVDPVNYISKYNGRIPLIHLKDMEDNEEGAYTELGNGSMNIKDIYNIGKETGCRWFIVEQDVCKRPPLESIKISFDNLKNMGIEF